MIYWQLKQQAGAISEVLASQLEPTERDLRQYPCQPLDHCFVDRHQIGSKLVLEVTFPSLECAGCPISAFETLRYWG